MNRRLRALGEANLKGWRGRVARPVADVVARRTDLSAADVRAVLGLALFGLSIYLLVTTVRRSLQSEALEP